MKKKEMPSTQSNQLFGTLVDDFNLLSLDPLLFVGGV